MFGVHITMLSFIKTNTGAQWNALKSLDDETKRSIPDSLEKAVLMDQWFEWAIVQPVFNELQQIERGKLLKELGEKFYGQLVNVLKEFEYDDIHDAIINFPKIYMRFNKGDKVGIWKTSDIRNGFIKVMESYPYPCIFTEGIIKGILIHMKAVGSMVSERNCKTDSNQMFCEYDIAWMHKIK